MKRNIVSALGLILLCLALALPTFAQTAQPAPALMTQGGYEADLDAERSLSVRAAGKTDWSQVAADVLAAQLKDGHLYYIQALDAGVQVMDYDIEAATGVQLALLDHPLTPDPEAERQYILDEEGAVYAQGVDAAALELLATYLPADPAAEQPVTEEPAAKAATTELMRGANGDEVKALQQALKDLGYPVGSVDGVYGGGTETAVRYLQSDMDLTETGKADAALQAAVIGGNAPKYEAYVELTRGDSGIRVRNLQWRLRALFYTKHSVDGSYGPDTEEAVKRFLSAIGSKQSGDAITAKQLASLFKKSAPECKTYYELRKDDNAPVVLRLNKRLKKLGYLSGRTGEAYDKHTVRAVKDFQAQVERKATGVADAKTQKLLFAKDAPVPEPTSTPGPGEQVVKNSTIKTLKSWLKANLGLDYDSKQAVEYLQDKLTDLGYLTVPKTSVYDSDTKAAVSAYQKANGIKANGLVNKSTLQKMFAVG
ncbi:peptidoglycan-binding protein [Bacillota bacterium Meth-B3]